MNSRHASLPVIVFVESNGRPRCINGLHVQTFIRNPFGEGTLITFANGDTVTVTEDFDKVAVALMADRHDG